MTLTTAQVKALQFLSERTHASPAELGEAITGGVKRGTSVPLKAQGLGRISGAMGWRLVKMHLAAHANSMRGGYSAFAITQAGRAALSSSTTTKTATGE